MPQPCVSLAMSPAGNYLATAHVDFLGIYLWANKTLYENVPLRSIDPLSEAPMLELPSLAFYETLEDDFMKIKLEDEDGEGELIKIDYKTPDQLDSQLITLSTLAESKWRNLLNLDVIKKRNKPKEAPKKPRQAPFFLPTVAGLEVKFDLNGVEIQEESRVRTNLVENLTAFGSVLKKSRGEGNYKTSIQHIINLNPSMIDFEVKSLDPMNGGSIELMLDFLKMLVEMFDSNLNFELAQSYLALFLKHHEKLVIDNQVLNEFLDTVEAAQNKTWSLVENQLLYGIGVVSNLRNFC
jgi:U3 small nucleolar RNA-associated protein 21